MVLPGPPVVAPLAAFAPGHVTGIFRPMLEAADVRARGSVGAGVVLDLGARARATVAQAPPGQGSVAIFDRGQLANYPISLRAVQLLPHAADHHVRIDLVHELPVSQGLSMSAAGSLASALATAHALGVAPEEAATAAHRAELELHGGLGGVPSILGGGLEVRRSAGLPPFGQVERTQIRMGLFLATTGARLPSPPLLSDPAFLARVAKAAETGIGQIPRPPVPWETALRLFEEFTDALALASPPLMEVIRTLRAQGVRAAQAMLGNTLLVWADSEDGEANLLSTLRRAHLTPWRVHVGEAGARMVPLHPR